MEVRTCRQTLAIQTHRILPQHTNSFGNMYGGRLLDFLDNVASIAASRMTRTPGMTAALDTMNFIKPLPENHSVCLEAYVTGAGNRSLEVFVKVMGEDLNSGERYLAATAFVTYVAILQPGQDFQMPLLKAESKEEKLVCAGYQDRQAVRKQKRLADKQFHQDLSTEIVWLQLGDQD
ncbi:acyl-CoA thioesterase [Aerococcus urinaehominis]|uniref:Acyl-CoA thioesterase n=1 Tax=Aerococcus urinaehominis TaxID=128944 RepID=A0A120IAW6_9LACT|nr:acyl-CoA thioesterase [Aerococcus urinaehominis]AMB99384.1 acyl-CoA thioesterase [Aerococcus urinaehominis]SDM23283.1 Acyl-CoA hydrolase [Aerococcus urinaehominis]